MEMHLKSSNTAKDYFCQGNQFLEAARRCFSEKNGFTIIKESKFQQLSAPCVVNAAFSCEMFLKSLLKRMEIQYCTKKGGHNLNSLYRQLPPKVQNILAKFCGNRKDNAVFENWIVNHSKDFVDIRYYIDGRKCLQYQRSLLPKTFRQLLRIFSIMRIWRRCCDGEVRGDLYCCFWHNS